MPKPEVVVFDIDGTLMDHKAAALAGLTTWIGSLGHPMSEDLARAWFDAENRHFASWCDGHISFMEQRRRRMRDVLPLLGRPVGSDAELDATFTGYLTAYETSWRPYPDVLPCLKGLTEGGYRLAVLSNGSEDQQRRKLRAMGLESYFEEVLTAEGLGAAKPSRLAYDRAARRLRTAAGACLYVGDDYQLDVVAARAAEWMALHIDRLEVGRDPSPLVSLGELLERLR